MAEQHFDFHYVKTPTGSISGQSVLKQTEDAINEVGEFSYQASLDAASALQKAEQAVDTANTANNTASNALTQVNAAVEKVNTLEVQVGDIAEQVEQANSKADQAVSTANSALSTAQEALSTANTALSNSEQAVTTANGANTTANNANSTAQDALEIAEEAKTTAESAVVDTDSAVEEMTTLLNQATQQATNATQQAQNAAASAASAASAAQSAVDDATEMLNAVVAYIPQNLTEDQQAQARENIAGVGFEDYATASTGGVVKVTGTDGITINSSGVIAVDFDAMPPEQMEQVVLSMVQEGGGISVDSNGQLYVDFDSMPTDKFDAMLKSIRVPIWLTKNTNFYVNGETGSDTLDEGRGLQSNKPFKTISACVKFVCDNYNRSRYLAYIVIEPMTYTERVELQNFTGSGGYILLVSASETEKVTIQNAATSAATLVVSTSQYWFRRIKFVQNITNSNIFKQRTVYSAAIAQSYTNSRFIDCDFVVNIDSSVESETISVRVFWGASFANPIFQGNNSLKYTCPDKYKGSGNAMLANGNSRISVYGGDEPCTLSISGDYSIVVSADSGEIFFNSNGPAYDVNIVVPNNETCTGKRYNASNGGVINTSNNGPEYIPGTIAGGVDSATYSWYR